MPATVRIAEASRTKERGDSFLVAIRTGVVNVGNIVHTITAGVTLWARYSPELRNPEVAALFGVRPAVAFRSSAPARKPVRDWLADPLPASTRRAAHRDWLADPKPKPTTPALKTRVDYQQTDRLRHKRADQYLIVTADPGFYIGSRFFGKGQHVGESDPLYHKLIEKCPADWIHPVDLRALNSTKEA